MLHVAHLGRDDAGVVLRVADNGKGLDLSVECEGHGLTSMRQRAVRLGGTIDIASRPGHGTTVTVTVPFARPRRFLSYGSGVATSRGR